MAKRENLELNIRVKGADDVEDLSDDIDSLFKKVDKLTARPAELLLTSKFGKIEGEIADLVLKMEELDDSDPELEITIARLNELNGDLDAVVGKIKEVDAAKADVTITADTSQVQRGVANVKGDLDKLPASAQKGRNAMANLWGNATQDLGAFIGISGSAGVAIGQLAEGAADAANDGEKMGSVLKGIGAQIGPMLAITAAVVVAQKVMQEFGDSSGLTAEEIRKISAALEDSLGSFDDWSNAVQDAFGSGTADTMDVFADTFLNMLGALEEGDEKVENTRKALGALGLDVGDLGGVLAAGEEGFAAYAEAQLLAGGATEESAAAAAGAMGDYDALVDAIKDGSPEFQRQAQLLFALGNALDDVPLEEAARNFFQVQRSIAGQNVLIDQAVASATDAATGQVNWNQALANYIDLQQQAARVSQETVDAAVAYGEALQGNTDRIAEWAAANVQAADSQGDITKAWNEGINAAGKVDVMWGRLLRDIDDNSISTQRGTEAWNFLRNELNLTEDEMVALTQTKLDEKLAADADEAQRLADEALRVAEAMADLGDTIADISVDDIENIASGLADALDDTSAAISHLSFAENLQHEFDDALDEASRFGPDLRELLDLQAAGVTITPDITLGELESDDAEFLQWVSSLQKMVHEGAVEAFTMGGVDAANAFIQAQAAAFLAANPELTLADFYRLMGLPSDGSIDAIIKPIVDAESKADALAILDGIIGVDPNNPMLAYLRLQVQTGAIDGVTAEIISLLLAQKYGINVDPQLAEFTPEQIAAAEAQLAATDVQVPVTPVVTDAEQAQEDLDTVAEPRDAPVNAAADTAQADEDLLNFTARDRFAEILAVAQVAEAEFLLGGGVQGVSKDRIADIVAIAHVIEARNVLDEAANPGGRPRIAHINVQTHNTSSVGAGGSPTAGGQAAIGPATLAGVTPLAPTPTSSISAVTQTPFVPAVQPINVTINAGVLGNHFDVERTVARALRRHQRVNGRR